MNDIAQFANINKTNKENINGKESVNNDSFIATILFHKYTLMK
jgi:hypothetical protein